MQAHVRSKSKGTREFIDILRLTEKHGLKNIGHILKILDNDNRYGYQEVLSILRCQQECTTGTKPLADKILKKYGLEDISSSHLPLSAYDELITLRRCE